MLAVGAEGDFALVHLGVAELEDDLGLLTGEALRADAHVGEHFVLHEADLGREEIGDDDVARAGDADAPDVERHAVLLELRGNFARGGAGVLTAVGDEHDAGERLAALQLDGLAQGVADGRGGGVGVEFVHPVERSDLGFAAGFLALSVGFGNVVLAARQGVHVRPEAEGDEVEVEVEAREEVELLVAEGGLEEVEAGDGFDLAEASSLRLLGEALGRVGEAFDERGALDVIGRHARVLDLHRGRAVHEQEQGATDAAFDGEGEHGPQQQEREQHEERDAQSGEQPAPGGRGGGRPLPIRPDAQAREHEREQHDPPRADPALEGKPDGRKVASGFHARTEKFEEQVGHDFLSHR